MSLINEALKKAQAQRQGGTPSQPPPPGMPPPGNAPPSAGPSHLWPIVLAFFGVAVLFAGGAALIVWGLMRSSGEQRDQTVVTAPADTVPQPSAPEAVPTPAPTPDESIESPASALPSEEVSSPGLATPTPAPTAIPSQPEPTPRHVAPAASPSPSPTATPARDVPAPARANPAVESFLARLEVRGVMAGGQRALLYNHDTQRTQAYEAGATISNELQLRVGEITMRSITFVDHDGFVYTKRF